MTINETLLHQLFIKGFGKPDALTESLGASAEEVAAALAALEADGATLPTRIGVRLSPSGKEKALERVAAQRAAANHARLDAEHDRFQPLNTAFKVLVTKWQIREVNGKQVPNDHSDHAYDAAIMADLDTVHAGISALLNDMAGHVPHLKDYVRRFDAALARIKAGEEKYVTAPIIDSYHTIWFELHQDMIGLLGRSRADEAAAGRAV